MLRLDIQCVRTGPEQWQEGWGRKTETERPKATVKATGTGTGTVTVTVTVTGMVTVKATRSVTAGRLPAAA